MSTTDAAAAAIPEWERNLPGKLEGFVNRWSGFQGTEQAGAQQFLQSLLDVYEANFKPGTIFEQHAIRVPSKTKPGAQPSLFANNDAPEYTTERIDMYLPKLCVWEMKAPAEKNLDKHHAQLLGYLSNGHGLMANSRSL